MKCAVRFFEVHAFELALNVDKLAVSKWERN
jgi:hypothetical protein